MQPLQTAPSAIRGFTSLGVLQDGHLGMAGCSDIGSFGQESNDIGTGGS